MKLFAVKHIFRLKGGTRGVELFDVVASDTTEAVAKAQKSALSHTPDEPYSNLWSAEEVESGVRMTFSDYGG